MKQLWTLIGALVLFCPTNNIQAEPKNDLRSEQHQDDGPPSVTSEQLNARHETAISSTTFPASQPSKSSAKFIWGRLSTKNRRLILSQIDVLEIEREIHEIIPGAQLTAIEFRWPKRSSTLYVVYHVQANAALKAKLTGRGYLNYSLLEELNQTILPFNYQIASALGIMYGQLGYRADFGLLAQLRIIGRLSSIELEINCHWGDCLPPNGLDCFAPKKKMITVFPTDDEEDNIHWLMIGPPIDLGGHPTETQCFHNLWK